MALNTLITTILTITLSGIFLLHGYWFFGGEKYLDAALPNDISKTKKRFSMPMIRMMNAISIAPVLVILAVLILSLYDSVEIITAYKRYIYIIASVGFSVRAILGWLFFHKLTKKELFLQKDKTIYSPLSLGVGLLFFAMYCL
ncbi:hypothetical protein DID77_03275 [Candidatus Marinamargulisbacteria bacterium SCGC AG-439-L15]|nr:hypothetical protein DID77_03275 [Candidatus Marinamargulisbacteria bacterium SCGC AG-439-L15]